MQKDNVVEFKNPAESNRDIRCVQNLQKDTKNTNTR